MPLEDESSEDEFKKGRRQFIYLIIGNIAMLVVITAILVIWFISRASV